MLQNGINRISEFVLQEDGFIAEVSEQNDTKGTVSANIKTMAI